MATFEEDSWSALKARVLTLPGLDPDTVAWPNFSFNKPDDGGIYYEVHHIPNNNERFLVSSDGPMRRQGVLQISVFRKKDIGVRDGNTAVGAIVAHFPVDFKLHYGSAGLRITKVPDVGQPLPTDTHWMIPVTIEYEDYA